MPFQSKNLENFFPIFIFLVYLAHIFRQGKTCRRLLRNFHCYYSRCQTHTVLTAILIFAPANFHTFTTLVHLYLHSGAAEILREKICETNLIPHLLVHHLNVRTELFLIYRSIYAGAHAVVDLQCVCFVVVYAYPTAFVIASCCLYFAFFRKKKGHAWEQNKTAN